MKKPIKAKGTVKASSRLVPGKSGATAASLLVAAAVLHESQAASRSQDDLAQSAKSRLPITDLIPGDGSENLADSAQQLAAQIGPDLLEFLTGPEAADSAVLAALNNGDVVSDALSVAAPAAEALPEGDGAALVSDVAPEEGAAVAESTSGADEADDVAAQPEEPILLAQAQTTATDVPAKDTAVDPNAPAGAETGISTGGAAAGGAVVVGAAAAGAGGGAAAGGAAAAAASAASAGSAAGIAAKGLLSGATVFYDFSGDGIFTAGTDASAITDARGNFSISLTTAQKAQVETGLNNLGKQLKLIVTGGTDVTNNTPFTGSLSTVADKVITNSSEINVFTTMKAAGMSSTQLTELLGKDVDSLTSSDFDQPGDAVEALALKLWSLVSDKVGNDADAAEAAMTALNNTLEQLSEDGDLASLVANLSASELEQVVGTGVDKAMALYNSGAGQAELDAAMQAYGESLDASGVFSDIADGVVGDDSVNYTTAFTSADTVATDIANAFSAPTITEADAATLIAASSTQYATGADVSMQATGTHVTPTLKQLQSLGVDAVLIDGAAAAIDPGPYGITIDLGTGTLNSVGIPDLISADPVKLSITDGQVTEVANLATQLHTAGVDYIGGSDGSLSVSAADLQLLLNQNIHFAAETQVTAQLATSGVGTGDVHALVVDIDAAAVASDVGVDIIDMTTNAATISEADAVSLVDAGVHFAAADVVDVQASGTDLSTSLKELHDLGVDHVTEQSGHGISLELGNVATGASPAAELLAFLQTYPGALFDGPAGSVDVTLEVTQTVYNAIHAATAPVQTDIVTALVDMGVDHVKVIGSTTHDDI